MEKRIRTRDEWTEAVCSVGSMTKVPSGKQRNYCAHIVVSSSFEPNCLGVHQHPQNHWHVPRGDLESSWARCTHTSGGRSSFVPFHGHADSRTWQQACTGHNWTRSRLWPGSSGLSKALNIAHTQFLEMLSLKSRVITSKYLCNFVTKIDGYFVWVDVQWTFSIPTTRMVGPIGGGSYCYDCSAPKSLTQICTPTGRLGNTSGFPKDKTGRVTSVARKQISLQKEKQWSNCIAVVFCNVNPENKLENTHLFPNVSGFGVDFWAILSNFHFLARFSYPPPPPAVHLGNWTGQLNRSGDRALFGRQPSCLNEIWSEFPSWNSLLGR